MSERAHLDPDLPADVAELIARERRLLAARAREAEDSRRHAWNLGGQGRSTRDFERATRPEGVGARPALLGGPPPRGRGPGA